MMFRFLGRYLVCAGFFVYNLGYAATTASPLEGLAPLEVQESNTRLVVPMATTDDLWERIRSGYAMPNLESDLVRDRENWYTARPDYIFRMTERSKK